MLSASNRARSARTSKRPDPLCLYSVKDVAQQCDLSEKTIRRHIEAGRLRVQRAGHSIRILHADLLAFLGIAPARAW